MRISIPGMATILMMVGILLIFIGNAFGYPPIRPPLHNSGNVSQSQSQFVWAVVSASQVSYPPIRPPLTPSTPEVVKDKVCPCSSACTCGCNTTGVCDCASNARSTPPVVTDSQYRNGIMNPYYKGQVQSPTYSLPVYQPTYQQSTYYQSSYQPSYSQNSYQSSYQTTPQFSSPGITSYTGMGVSRGVSGGNCSS